MTSHTPNMGSRAREPSLEEYFKFLRQHGNEAGVQGNTHPINTIEDTNSVDSSCCMMCDVILLKFLFNI
jgi:hypothetical protein